MTVKQTVKQQPNITAVIAAAIECTVNTALKYDPASKHAVSELTDILAIEVTPATVPTITLFCTGNMCGVRVMNRCNSLAATRLTGSPMALFDLLQHPHSLANSSVELSGDVQLLQSWQAVLNSLDIDWQECLQEYLGDIAGPIAAAAMGKTGHWLHHQWRYHQRQCTVYLEEGLRVVPTKAEFDDFNQQVDGLILATDRLEAGIQNTQRKLDSSTVDKSGLKKSI